MLHFSKDQKSHCLGPDVNKIFLWFLVFPPVSSSPSTADESESLFPLCSAVCHLEFSLRFQSIWLRGKWILRHIFSFPYFRHFACKLIVQIGVSCVCFWQHNNIDKNLKFTVLKKSNFSSAWTIWKFPKYMLLLCFWI